MSSKFQNDAIFWVSVDKIRPNPYQPRRDFNEESLRDLAESIRQYGVLQPLTVTRNEETKEDGGLKVHYELIAGERRHRAAQMANLSQVPVIIRSEQEDSQVKLELAIIENLQREDLNPIERAEAFDKLADEFDFTHKKIAEKIGKSREYVSNSMRLLKLPEKIKQAIISGKMTEGHARPIMMLRDNPEKQETLFKEIIHKDLTVREAEEIARRDAQDKVRKKKNKIDPETKELEEKLSETFGTRVKIEERDVGGKLVIDFFSNEDLESIIELMRNQGEIEMSDMMEEYVNSIAKDKKADDNKTDSKAEGGTMAETLEEAIASARAKKQTEEQKTNSEDEKTQEKARSVTADSVPEPTENSKETSENPEPEKEKTHSTKITEESSRQEAEDSQEKSVGEAREFGVANKTQDEQQPKTALRSDNSDQKRHEVEGEDSSGVQPKESNPQNEKELTEDTSVVLDEVSKEDQMDVSHSENIAETEENTKDEDTQSGSGIEPSVPTFSESEDKQDKRKTEKQQSDEDNEEIKSENEEESVSKDSGDDMYAVSNFSI